MMTTNSSYYFTSISNPVQTSNAPEREGIAAGPEREVRVLLEHRIYPPPPPSFIKIHVYRLFLIKSSPLIKTPLASHQQQQQTFRSASSGDKDRLLLYYITDPRTTHNKLSLFRTPQSQPGKQGNGETEEDAGIRRVLRKRKGPRKYINRTNTFYLT